MVSKEQKIKLAQVALAYWVEAVKTGSWENYLSLLTEDYSFWLPDGKQITRGFDLKHSKEQLIASSFHEKRLKAYSQKPKRISVGHNTVVFEFLFNAKEGSEYFQNCLALSFDLVDHKISACREYHCVLMDF